MPSWSLAIPRWTSALSAETGVGPIVSLVSRKRDLSDANRNLAFLYPIEYSVVVLIIQRTEGFAHWLTNLKDKVTKARLLRRLEKAEMGLLGDVAPVGEGVMEMREFFGPGWRMYYVQRGSVVIVMLGGGDKSTQQADIASAKALAATLED